MNLRYLLLFLPLLFPYATLDYPEVSYFLSWMGSIYILIISIAGFVKPLPTDRNRFEQIMRPLFIPQIIFAGYMSVTSVFYFLDINGYYYFEKDSFKYPSQVELQEVALCQFYYLAGHAFFVLGILLFMNYEAKHKYKIADANVSSLIIQITIYLSLLSLVIKFIPGLSQILEIIANLSLIASVLGFAYALPEKKSGPLLISGGLFAANFLNALFSGWKESIIMPIILLTAFLYPYYKRVVLLAGVFSFFVFFYYVPTYNSIVRKLSWSGEMSGKEASKIAIDAIINNEVDIAESNWGFLTGRLSEISMFAKYVAVVPQVKEYYGFDIVLQGLESIVPRIFYPDKPITEILVMQRVYDIGVVSNLSSVSAKPPFIVDSYLSFGFVGISICMFILGALSSKASVLSEKLFGGYEMGTCLVYLGLFKCFLRGNCFEFMFNNIFWGFVLIFVFHKAALAVNIIERKI